MAGQQIQPLYKSYFSANKILEYGAIFNLALSDRSDGKTFDCKVRALNEYENDKHITIYMRRFKSEITEQLYNNFFDEVIEKVGYEHYKKYEFNGSKRGIKIRLKGTKEWDDIIYFMPLTMSGKLKSQISNIERVFTIDYDEYVPLNNEYARGEIELLLEFYKSIDRDRNTTKLIMLGNKISPFNPLFDYFNIDLSIEREKIRLYKNGTLAVQIYKNEEHRKVREKSAFNELVKGTEYEDYNNGGILIDYNVKFKQRENATYYCRFITAKGKGSIWYDKSGNFYISRKIRNDGFIITDKVYDITEDYCTIKVGKFSQLFKKLYNQGRLFFEDKKSFNNFSEILKKAGAL